MKATRILLVEDNELLADGLLRSLTMPGYAVDRLAHGERADSYLKSETYDLVVLDVGLPGIDGFEVLRRLRARGTRTPVLVLTARDAVEDRIRGLDLGADDYLTKPFVLGEFEARVRALIRRADNERAPQLVCGTLRMDTAALRAWMGDQELALTSREWTILEVLLRQLGQVISKKRITQAVKDWEQEVTPNTVEVHISRLRRKLGSTGPQIRAVRGFGYLLEDPDTRH
ncbi:MAG: response regulator transcription factor [Steroidobacteraceae bacterium]